MLNSPLRTAPDSKALYDYLMRQNKGDNAWNGTLVLLRKAKPSPAKQSDTLLIKEKVTKWATFCELPKKAILPYEMIVKNAQGLTYLISIQNIQAKGIYVKFRELKIQEHKK